MIRILSQTDYRFEQLKNPLWRDLTTANATAFSDRWLRIDNSKIRLVPADYNSNTYTVGYVQIPTTMTATFSPIDSRIYLAHQEYLKFPAAAYLLQFRGDETSLRLADQYLKIFETLIGSTGVVR